MTPVAPTVVQSVVRRVAPILALALALAGTPAMAEKPELAEWDQDRVTELAVELAGVIHDMHRTFRRQPRPDVASMQSNARFRFTDTLRVLRTESRALAAELEGGAGFDETFFIARRMRTLIRDAREDARRMNWNEPMSGIIARAEGLLDQLRPFYFGGERPR